MRTASRRMAMTTVVFFLAAGVSPQARGADVANWLGGDGLWSDPAKWSTGIVPANTGGTTYVVNIDSGNPIPSRVTLNNASSSSSSIEAMVVDADDQLSMAGHELGISGPNVTVNGTLEMSSGGLIFAGAGTIGGSGTVSMPGSGWPTIAAASGSLTIDTGVTLRRFDTYDPYFGLSSARVGSASAALINRGLVVADNSVLTVRASVIDNQGAFEVRNNGTLLIDAPFSLSGIGTLLNNGGHFGNSGTLHNAGATLTISQPQGWVVRGTIDGGTIHTIGDGTVLVPMTGDATLNNVTLDGTLHVRGWLNVIGTFGGTGTILVKGIEPLEAAGNVSLPGAILPSGITVRGGVEATFDVVDKARVFISSNEGRIRAERGSFGNPARLKLFGGPTIVNKGTLEISDGGILSVMNNLTFGDVSKLVVDGGGLLEVTGDLGLTTTLDSLEVFPRPGGEAYSGDLIATYTGSLLGTFSTVTPGITVSYATPNQIRISGTPVPEPTAGVSIAMFALAATLRRRR